MPSAASSPTSPDSPTSAESSTVSQSFPLLQRTISAIRPLDSAAMDAAQAWLDNLAKPPGSLGVLEDVARKLAGLAGECPPPLPDPAGLAIFAGDHGVHAQGVSPWPQDVTAAMVATFLSGRSVVNALARQTGARVTVVDVGVATRLDPAPGLMLDKVRPGTNDVSTGPAMTRAEALRAIDVGIHTATAMVADGCRCLLTGDMGIANTTPAAALIAAFTGAAATDVTGRGTGIDDATWARKVEVVAKALALHQPDPTDPLGVLAALGGLEHAALAGFLLGGVAARVPVILDGVASSAAALVAAALAPDVTAGLIAGHLSTEPGARRALTALRLRPLLDVAMRLGEGSGAVLALPLVQAAARVVHEVATITDVLATTRQPAQHAPQDVPPADTLSAPSRATVRSRARRGELARRRRILVLGGARSGKSGVAERLVEGAPSVTYLATGPTPTPDDPEWQERVRRHRARRPRHWTTVETRDLAPFLTEHAAEPLVIDCLGAWLTAVMERCGAWDDKPDAAEAIAAELDAFVDAWRDTNRTVVAVSNEVGSGVVPPTRSGRLFRDQLGELNARIATESDEVWLVTAGIPRRLR
jgi:nicotinate-nucleotide--dimethylbenzimidazole phosphoribosyltransferase